VTAVAALASNTSASAPPPVVPPVNADDVDRTDVNAPEAHVQPRDAGTAAWLSLVQALYASAEFRFIR
jgi:hypothetical protein